MKSIKKCHLYTDKIQKMNFSNIVPLHIKNGNTNMYSIILKNAQMPDKSVHRIFNDSKKEFDLQNCPFTRKLAIQIQSSRTFDSYGNPINIKKV